MDRPLRAALAALAALALSAPASAQVASDTLRMLPEVEVVGVTSVPAVPSLTCSRSPGRRRGHALQAGYAVLAHERLKRERLGSKRPR